MFPMRNNFIPLNIILIYFKIDFADISQTVQRLQWTCGFQVQVVDLRILLASSGNEKTII